MPPFLALLGTVSLVTVLLLADRRRDPEAPASLWLPTIWLVILASRPVSLWFSSSGNSLAANAEDGSSFDRALLSVLLVGAAAVLFRRGEQWGRWISANPWLVLLFLYALLSLSWSDYPGIGLRRLVRAFGATLMILVVLSTRNPVNSISTVLRRCRYILVPVSILLIKYYRDYGVAYDYWTGEEMLVGAASDKNGLGRLCLIAVVSGAWDLLTPRAASATALSSLSNAVAPAGVLGLSAWLLFSSNSATSLVSSVVGVFALFLVARPLVRRQAHNLGTLLLAALFGPLLLWSFGGVDALVEGLGRDMTLTTRTFVWADLMAVDTNPIFGVGYDTFWLGDRLRWFVDTHQVSSAHNGYLEVYLELGAVGLTLFFGTLWRFFRASQRLLARDGHYGSFRLVILLVFLIYNITESGYKATTLMFFVLLLAAVDGPRTVMSTESQPSRPVRPEAPPRRNPVWAARSLRIVPGATVDHRAADVQRR
jgi:O-antigen ligase